MHDLGGLGGPYADNVATGINSNGQVVGASYTAPDDNPYGYHTILYSNGTMQDLGTLGGTRSQALAINASSQITGDAYTTGDAADHAFLYSDGAMHNLGTLGGFNSYGIGINASDQVVDDSYLAGDSAFHAFLYSLQHEFLASGGVMVDLNSLISPLAGWTLERADAINDADQITGFGEIGGETHAFLLTPVPEPSAFLSAVLCTITLATNACKRSRTRQ